MSIAEGAMAPQSMASHIKKGIECQDIEESYIIEVPSLTFKEALKQAGFSKVDFLSIDLEGYEIQALEGFDFEEIRPKYILIEVQNLETTDSFLSSLEYRRIERMSYHDYLYTDCRVNSCQSII